MRKLILYTPAIDRNGAYHDAGAELTVGAEDNADTHLTTARADALIDQGSAVTLAEAAEDEKPAVDPLDHDANGRKGGAKAKAST